MKLPVELEVILMVMMAVMVELQQARALLGLG
jgi:hypothetical protein